MQLLHSSGLRPRILCEPFCGGASVSLQLLANNLVDYVYLGDIDPGIAAFWATVFFDHEWLTRQVQSVELSVKRWQYFRETPGKTTRDLALSTLYLNRTSFSGITKLPVGPIGGLKQQSVYSIGCRFNPHRLVERIRAAASLTDRISGVHCGDWKETIAKARQARRGPRLHYLDPPFLGVGDKLYRQGFKMDDFKGLSQWTQQSKDWWLLSCGDDQAATLFRESGFAEGKVETLYTGRRWEAPSPQHEVLFSNLAGLEDIRLWRNAKEWNPRYKSPAERLSDSSTED